MIHSYRFATIAALLLLTTTACAPLLIGGATSTGVAVAQERSVGSAIDDTAIKTRIWNSYLQSNTQNLYSNVNIEVNEGRVLLTGAVATPESAAKAVQLAWNASGVREVINEIQVTDRGGPNVYARDAWITAQVKARLIAEKNVRSINYTIETVNNIVYIMGLARSEAELAQVLNVASRVKGVQQVISHARQIDDPLRVDAAPVAAPNNSQAATEYSEPAPRNDYSAEPSYDDTTSYDTDAYQNPAPIESYDLQPQY